MTNAPRKFRVWHSRREEMYTLYLHHIADLRGGFGSRDSKKLAAIEQGNVMQYTGLDDAEGTEIYEGDVMRSRKWGYHVKVVWSNSLGGYYMIHWGGDHHTEGCNHLREQVIESSGYKIIGNHFEIPELLEEVAA